MKKVGIDKVPRPHEKLVDVIEARDTAYAAGTALIQRWQSAAVLAAVNGDYADAAAFCLNDIQKLCRQNQLDQAREILKRSKDLTAARKGDDLMTAFYLNLSEAEILGHEGKRDQALSFLDRARDDIFRESGLERNYYIALLARLLEGESQLNDPQRVKEVFDLAEKTAFSVTKPGAIKYVDHMFDNRHDGLVVVAPDESKAKEISALQKIRASITDRQLQSRIDTDIAGLSAGNDR